MSGEVRPLANSAADLSAYATVAYVDSGLSGKAGINYVDEADEGLATGISVIQDATDALDLRQTNFESEMAQELGGKANTSHTHAATDVTSGTLADARLSSNIPLKDAANTFTQTQSFAAITATIVTASGTITAPAFAAAGVGQTTLGNATGGVLLPGSITAATAAAKAAIIKGAASQSANLTEWQNSAGTVLASVSAAGALVSTAYIQTSSNIVSTSVGSSFGSATFSATTALQCKSNLDSRIPFAVRGFSASQSANLTEWQNSAGTVLASVSAAGAIVATLPTRHGIYTFATVPTASSYTNYQITISDRSSRSAYSDGTNWRFASDDAIIS